ncbi:MAG: transcriptional regulator GcvA [Pseudolabrys sp.]|nr:transcriptional regulator GcvA [Pseudolabrys sp.]
MRPLPPLSALRAFEAAARHLSLTRAAEEMHVTPGALSHQIRGLEDLLGVKLFERKVRAIALTAAGRQLYPGLQTGFGQIRDAVASLDAAHNSNILVVSTSPGMTSKWLAPRLSRFSNDFADIDVRISSSLGSANFETDGVDIAVRNLPAEPAQNAALEIEKLADISLVAVCSPRLIERYGAVKNAKNLARLPLIHAESFSPRVPIPNWGEWFGAAGISGPDLRRGLHFNSADHALDAAGEGAGVLLAHDLLAYDDLRTGRLIIPVRLSLPSGRAYHLVWPKGRKLTQAAEGFRRWIKAEIAAMDWKTIRGRPGTAGE